MWGQYLILHLSLPALMLSTLTRYITTVPVTEKHMYTLHLNLHCVLYMSVCVYLYRIYYLCLKLTVKTAHRRVLILLCCMGCVIYHCCRQ